MSNQNGGYVGPTFTFANVASPSTTTFNGNGTLTSNGAKLADVFVLAGGGHGGDVKSAAGRFWASSGHLGRSAHPCRQYRGRCSHSGADRPLGRHSGMGRECTRTGHGWAGRCARAFDLLDILRNGLPSNEEIGAV